MSVLDKKLSTVPHNSHLGVFPLRSMQQSHSETSYMRRQLYWTWSHAEFMLCVQWSHFAHSSFSSSHLLWLGTLQWAVHFSPHLKDTTTRWVGGGKSGLASTSLCAPPCGRWCLTLTVSHWRHAHQRVCSQSVSSVFFTDIAWLGKNNETEKVKSKICSKRIWTTVYVIYNHDIINVGCCCPFCWLL